MTIQKREYTNMLTLNDVKMIANAKVSTEQDLVNGMKSAVAIESQSFLYLGKMAYRAFEMGTQSMDKWALQLGVSKGTFVNWKQLGMALSFLNYSEDEMIRCGRTTMYRIGSIVRSQGIAWDHADVIAKVITDRAARRIDDLEAAEILNKINPKKKADKPNDKAISANGSKDNVVDGPDYPEWKSRILSLVAKCQSEAEFRKAYGK